MQRTLPEPRATGEERKLSKFRFSPDALRPAQAIDQRDRIGNRVAVPADVLVGTHQHELAAVEAGGRRGPQARERHAARTRGVLQRAGAVCRAEIEEREALAEAVIGGASGGEPEM